MTTLALEGTDVRLASGKQVISRRKWYEKIGYTPRRGQQAMEQAIASGCRYIGGFAFPRAGKSFGVARYAEPLLLEPNKHVWIVAPTYKLGSKEFGYIWNDFAETGFLPMARRRNFDIRGGNMQISFPWGSMVEVVSAENPASLRAEEIDLLILAEASQLGSELWERHLFARTEKRKGLTIVPTTPQGYNWVYDKFRVPSLKTLPGGVPNPNYDPLYWSAVISADPTLGDIYEPGIYDDDYLVRAKKMLPYPIYLEQVGGDFASYAGLIYHFNPSIHRVPRFDIPKHWTHIVGWDPGANERDPCAILVGSYDPKGCLYWWAELYTYGLSLQQYWQRVLAMIGGRTPQFVAIDRSARQIRTELAEMGVATTCPPEKAINARIVKKNELMMSGKWKVLEGTCPNLEREILAWEWDDNTLHAGKPRQGQSCHALDATGYAELIQVQLPEDVRDPLAPDGEDPETTEFWKPFRQMMQRREEAMEDRDGRRLFEPDPFEEQGLLAGVGSDVVEDAWFG